MASQPDRNRFTPAAGYRWLMALYDPVLALVLREAAWKSALVEQVAPCSGERILDLGCGTGTLTVMLKQKAPGAEISGLDPDPAALERARAKADEAGVTITFAQGFADEPGAAAPAENRYDKVVSSLMFHHLDAGAKRRALAATLARLKPGGEFHIADWGRPHNVVMRALFVPVQLLDGFATTRDNVHGRLPELMREAGFEEVAETQRWATALGSLSFYRGRRPA